MADDASEVDDGSAAHEPDSHGDWVRGLVARNEQLARELRMAQEKLARLPEDSTGETVEARICGLTVMNDDLWGEIRRLRGMLLSRIEEVGETVATDDPVKADIERTIDHLQRDKVSPKLRGDLRRATDQAERVKPGANDAVWKARR